MRGTLSILGLYNYDTSIFENFVVPEGVDAATAVNSIIYENAELEIIYPDPDAMKFFIGLWSSRESVVWARILNAITQEYNPIENYDRQEDWTDTDDEDTTANNTGYRTRTPNLTGINTREVAAFNGTSLVTSEKNTGTETGNEQLSTSDNGTGSRDLTRVHSGRVHGNIGVTTSQQMLNQELEIAGKVDIYKYISESFKHRFCLMVY